MSDIQVGCLQIAIHSGDIDGNRAKVEEALRGMAAKSCRLVVLPEMWACGFAYSGLRAASGRTPEMLAAMKDWADRFQTVIVGSLPEFEGGWIYNTAYVVDCGGEIAGKYRKIHLFSHQGEHLRLGRGESPLVCETRVGRLGVMICYDLRFPELARTLALRGAQIICAPALWPIPRIDHWSILLRGRAVENQLFVVGCNGCGTEGKLLYGGASAIVSPFGKVVAEASDGEEALIAGIDMEEIAAFRRLIDCFADRVPQAYDN